MTHIPVDSTDAREIREAEQERAEAESRERRDRAQTAELDRRRHAVACVGGWLGEDSEGRPIPCPLDRPHLMHVPCWTCSVSYQACVTQQSIRRGRCCDGCQHSRRTPPSQASTSPVTESGHALGATGSMAEPESDLDGGPSASAHTYPSGPGPVPRAGRVAPPTDKTPERTRP